MVVRHGHDLTLVGQETTGITGIGDVERVLVDERDVGCATGVRLHEVAVDSSLFSIVLQRHQLLTAFRSQQQGVDNQEGLFESKLELAVLEVLVLLQLIDEMLLREERDLLA